MTLGRLDRWRLPVLAVTALVLALVVIAAILLVGRIGTPDRSPSPTATVPTSPSGASGDTPEAAVRAFFEAFAEARETSDPAVIEPFVTSTDSSAYLTASSFLQGQAEQGKGSVTTVQELTGFDVTTNEDRAIVEFTYEAGGYDIDLASGEPLESPQILDPSRVRAEVIRIGDRWLLDSYEEVAE